MDLSGACTRMPEDQEPALLLQRAGRFHRGRRAGDPEGEDTLVGRLVVEPRQVVPGEIEEGEEVTVNVTVTNIGEEEGVCSVELELDGIVVSVESTSLMGGASTTITLILRDAPVGEHTIRVDALTGGFVVTSPEEPEPKPDDYTVTNYIVTIVVAVAVGTGLVYYLYWKKNR